MPSDLDCMLIGYNDMAFSDHVRMVMSKGKRSPEHRIFTKDHLLIEGKHLPYMDVFNHYINKRAAQQNRPSDSYYHVAEVPNLASVYLSSYLQTRGFTCEFVSLYAPERKYIAELLVEREPLAIAITTTFYLMPTPVIDIVHFIRQYNQQTKIIVGGPLISNLCQDLEEETLSYVFREMGCDIYVREPQGEETLRRILTALKRGESLVRVPNLYLPVPGGYQFTGAEPENVSLDACAINWTFFTNDELVPTVQTRTARSCAFKCSFCDYPIRAGALTLASVETVENELRKLTGRGVKNVIFIDDTFNVPIGRFKELCQMMIRNRFGFEWFSYFRCSHVRDEETFDLMKESGCRAVFLGIESGDQDVLTNMNKVAKLDQYRFGMEQLHKRGITTFASFIAGFPGETDQSITNTIQFINETRPTFYRIEPWWYNQRSPIYSKHEKFAIKGQGYRWQHATMDVYAACDATDRVFQEVTESLWMPMYNFDFWALPYLLGKGLTVEEVIQFHILAREVLKYNLIEDLDMLPEVQEAKDSACQALEEFCNSLTFAPAKYHPPDALVIAC